MEYFNIFISLFLLGVSYSIFVSVIFASAALIVKKQLVSFAFGMLACFINISLFISPLIVGKIHEIYNDYTIVNKIVNLDFELLLLSNDIFYYFNDTSDFGE